jgi:hypothetical protein
MRPSSMASSISFAVRKPVMVWLSGGGEEGVGERVFLKWDQVSTRGGEGCSKRCIWIIGGGVIGRKISEWGDV